MVRYATYCSFSYFQYFVQSRNIVFAPHCNPTDPQCLDILTTVYNTLLCATLLTWSPAHPLTPTAFADFVQSVLRSLPSSSNEAEVQPSHVTVFGDYLIDMIWSVDTQLDELLAEARSAVAAAADGKVAGKDLTALVNKAKKAQQNAETDKQRIPSIVMKLLVLNSPFCRVLCSWVGPSGVSNYHAGTLPGKIGHNSLGECWTHT